MKQLIFIAFLLISSNLWCQPDIPKEYELNTVEDYENQEDLVLKSLKWLLDNRIDQNLSKRNELNAFVLIWLSGSPEVMLDIDSDYLPFIETDETLFFTFLHGLAYYQIRNTKEDDTIRLHAEGLKAVARQINRCEGCVEKSKDIKKILKAHRKNKMYVYVKELMQQ